MESNGNRNKTGLYFCGQAIADLKPDPADPFRLRVSLGSGAYFGSLGAGRAIQELGLSSQIVSYFMGAIPNDGFGVAMKRDFSDGGVSTRYSPVVDNIQTFSYIAPDENGRDHYSFYRSGNESSRWVFSRKDLPNSLGESGCLFCFGSALMNVSSARDVWTDYMKEQAAAGHIVYFDPNTRPSIIADHDRYVERVLEIAQHASIFRASSEDMEYIFPDLSFRQGADRFLDRGVRAVIVTEGKAGNVIYLKDQSCRVVAKTLHGITNTVGAGDNFNAGMLVELARRGLVTKGDLVKLSLEQWQEIAEGANLIARAHLIRANGLDLPKDAKNSPVTSFMLAF